MPYCVRIDMSTRSTHVNLLLLRDYELFMSINRLKNEWHYELECS